MTDIEMDGMDGETVEITIRGTHHLDGMTIVTETGIEIEIVIGIETEIETATKKVELNETVIRTETTAIVHISSSDR
jgi:hypothetical protein